MNLDGLTLSLYTRELANDLTDAQIKSLVQIDKHTLVFKLNKDKRNFDFVITVGNNPACYISKGLKDLPKEPTSLCMFLRKHLEGSRLTNIEQVNGDRILCVQADKLSLAGELINVQIYIELIGKYSNCIFVSDGQILESLIHVTPLMSQERTIAPKLPYQLPPNSNRVNLLEFSKQEILSLLKTYKSDSIALTIRNIFNGIGPYILKEICYRSNIKEKASLTNSSEEELENILTTLAHNLCQLKEEILVNNVYYKYTTKEGKNYLAPLELTYPNENRIFDTTLTSLAPLIEAEIVQTGNINTAGQELQRLINHAITKETLRNEKIATELADSSKAEHYKLLGDLLMIYAYQNINYITEITLSNILVDPPEDITIPLKPGLSLSDNAQLYYKQYTKLKNRTISGKYQLEQSTIRLKYLASIQYSLTLATDRQSVQEIKQECEAAGLIKKSKKNLQIKKDNKNYLHFTLPEGEVFIGKNNQQNDYLTHHFAKPYDIWFHTLNIQGSHVIFRPLCPIEQIDETTLIKLASFAAYYSKAKESSKVPVDYTLIRNIKKPPASPLGFVIYTNQKTLYVDPQEPKF